MKTTPFTETHISLGAKMHEFAGYNMPIEYSGIIDEHLTVCQGVGVFDVSHMGRLLVEGPDRVAFLQHVLSSNVLALEQARGVIESTRSDIAKRQGELAQANNALQLLLGSYGKLPQAQTVNSDSLQSVKLPAAVVANLIAAP